MNAVELKNLQAPLKEKYRSEPGSARITLKAVGKINDGISCKVETGRAFIEAGLHPQPAEPGCSPVPVICYWKPWSPVPGVTLAQWQLQLELK